MAVVQPCVVFSHVESFFEHEDQMVQIVALQQGILLLEDFNTISARDAEQPISQNTSMCISSDHAGFQAQPKRKSRQYL